jgi:hypothetical protein
MVVVVATMVVATMAVTTAKRSLRKMISVLRKEGEEA